MRTNLKLFDPFSLKPQDALLDEIQELLYYAESRFRQALLALNRDDVENQKWKLDFLGTETWFIMARLGIATAIGQPMEVPILVRSMADQFLDSFDNFPVHFSPELMAVLDADLDPKDPGCLVQQYAYNWWDLPEIPIVKESLNYLTMDECLDTHRQQKLPTEPDEGPLQIRHPVPVLELAYRPTADAGCSSCHSNAKLIQDLLAELQKSWAYADSIQVSTAAKLDSDMRRAAGFYTLHEQALIKEHDSAPAPASSSASQSPAPEQTQTRALRPSQPHHRSKYPGLRKYTPIAEKACAELERLKALPSGSHKWVWGTDLTEEEVLNMGHPSKVKDNEHSGYNVSLTGTLSGNTSEPTPPRKGTKKFTPLFSPLASDNLSLSDTGAESMLPLPLTLRNSPPRPRFRFLPDSADADSTSAGAGAIHITAMEAGAAWPSDDSDAAADGQQSPPARLPTALEVANAWPSDDSDADQQSPPRLPTALEVANAWFSGTGIDSSSSDDGNLNYPQVTAYDAGTAWDLNESDTSAGAAYVNASDVADAFLSDDSSSDINLTPQYNAHDFSFLDESWLPDMEEEQEQDNW